VYRDIVEVGSASAGESEVGAMLESVVAEASVPNWDGYGARPVSALVHEQARAFVAAIPRDVPEPDVVPEPDGEIAFEWDFGPWRVLSISVGPDGLLSYAVTLGPHARDHGTAVFVDRMPRSVLEALRRFIASRCVPSSAPTISLGSR
jgi:hypothetical protein